MAASFFFLGSSTLQQNSAQGSSNPNPETAQILKEAYALNPN
jgi:hypothetical protein